MLPEICPWFISTGEAQDRFQLFNENQDRGSRHQIKVNRNGNLI
jgi:hypothetical protein